MSARRKPQEPEQDVVQESAQREAEQAAQAAEMNEAPASGAVYIVNGERVDPNGKPVDKKSDD